MTTATETLPPATTPAAIPTTATYYIAFIGLGLVSASLGPTLPALAEQTGAGLDQISNLFVARSLGFLLGSFIIGRAYDRMRGHPLMAIMFASMAGLLLLIPFASWLWLLIGLMLLTGFTLGSCDVGGNTLLVWLHQERVGPYMNGLHFIWGVGAFLSPLLLAQAILQGDGELRWGYWLLALLILPLPLLIARLPSPRARATDDTAILARTNLFALVLITLFFFFYISGEVGLSGWVYTYTVKLKLTTESNAAYLNSALFGALTATRLVGIPIAARFRPAQILFVDLLICIASAGLVLLFPQSLTALWAGTIGLGIGMASIFPTMLDLAQRYLTLSGSINSWFFVGGSLGGMSVPRLIGQLFESTGPHVVFVAVLASFVLATVILGALVATQTQKVVAPVVESHRA